MPSQLQGPEKFFWCTKTFRMKCVDCFYDICIQSTIIVSTTSMPNVRKSFPWHPHKQARKPRSYASPKLWPTHLLTYSLTGVKCRATSVAKNTTNSIQLEVVMCALFNTTCQMRIRITLLVVRSKSLIETTFVAFSFAWDQNLFLQQHLLLFSFDLRSKSSFEN